MNLRDDDFWYPLDKPWSFGLDYTNQTSGRGPGPEFGFLFFGKSDDYTSTSETLSGAEFFAGMRHTFGTHQAGPHPYVGVGGSLVGATLDTPGYRESDGTVGLYGHAGITFPLGDFMEFGFDFRVLRGTDVELPGLVDTDLDYERFSLVLGWSF